MTNYHTPALLNQCLDGLNINPSGIYVDATFGGGGHSAAIIEKLDNGHLFGFDQDDDARANINDEERFTFVHHNFSFLKHFMRYYNVDFLDGILADLGVSFHHFDTAERGFSFRFDAPLDMRMNQNATLTAASVVNEYSLEQLVSLFRLYGDFRNAYKLADEICKVRAVTRIKTTTELKQTVEKFFPSKTQSKFLARLFQAIRMEVNQEVETLKTLLLDGTHLLKPGGRFVVITYHSIEDRIVKNFFKSGNFEGKVEQDFYGNVVAPLKAAKGGIIVPDENEISENPRSRSAKLRIAEKI
ncbi:MAG: 16S rRNA (cytosine(1402)-N(4))-methyltransferase RsmH [Salinivirgaceae bacterium]